MIIATILQLTHSIFDLKFKDGYRFVFQMCLYTISCTVFLHGVFKRQHRLLTRPFPLLLHHSLSSIVSLFTYRPYCPSSFNLPSLHPSLLRSVLHPRSILPLSCSEYHSSVLWLDDHSSTSHQQTLIFSHNKP